MKRNLILSIIICCMVVPTIYANGGDKVTVCHKPRCTEGPVHPNLPLTLEINVNALEGHLGHGDTLGPCVGAEGEGEGEGEGECAEIECYEDQVCISGVCVDLPEDGEDGQDGEDGSDGQDGSQGPDGLDGQDGTSCSVLEEDGCATIECDDGTSATVCGRDGEDGVDGQDGEDGEDGQDGVDGEDGSSCTVTETDSGATISCDDGTTVTINDGQDAEEDPFDDDGDNIPNNLDQCSGTPVGTEVDEIGCEVAQEKPPGASDVEVCIPNNEYDLFGGNGGDSSGEFCGLCGSGCELTILMMLITLGFMKCRKIVY